MLKPDKWIILMAKKNGLIEPFVEKNVKIVDGEKAFSFGVQPYGYDLRLDEKFLLPINSFKTIIDVKSDKESIFEEVEDDKPIIMPNSYIVGYSVEKLKMPKGITGLIWGKSSLATIGIIINTTPVDAGFEG